MTLAIVGGYRLVRKLGHGDRATVWLGHPEDGAAAVAIKLPTTADAQSAAREIEALGRAAGPHVVEVLDIATTTDGRVALVLERLRSTTLAALLADRGGLRPGEVVTVLAPLAGAVERMHRAGVTHGRIRASSVGFTDHGAPVLMGFGDARALSGSATPAQRDAHEGVLADRQAFLGVAQNMLEGAAGSGGVLEWLESNAVSGDWIERFGARLFAWAAPTPIDFVMQDAPQPRPVEPVLRRPRTQSREKPTLLDTIASVVGDEVVESLRGHVASVRPRFWVAGGAVVVALVLAAMLVPVSEGRSTEAAPLPTATQPSDAAAESASDEAVAGDDPVAAVRVLIATREQCIRELSILCLDAVDQPGSSAYERDLQVIREIQAGGKAPAPLDVADAVLDERLGGTALVVVTSSNGEPAPLLLMRSEAGWRIRDYVDAG